MQNEKVVAVVVTYNRKELLIECLNAILAQTVSVEKIVLINNASTDGTEDLLRENGLLEDKHLLYKLMSQNTGGAGGFYEGIKCARQLDCDWVWIMDDDTIPNPNCLQQLLCASETIKSRQSTDIPGARGEISFLASAVYGMNGEFMNLPTISNRPSENGYAYWYKYLSDGIVSISSATFVSVLFNKKALDCCGLPCKDYFIWGDDTEYTMRLTKYYGDAYFVGNSIAIHKRINAKPLSLYTETNPNRIKMFSYAFRNRIINARYYDQVNKPVSQMIEAFCSAFKYLFRPMGAKKAKALIKGNLEGITKYKKFKRYIDCQIQNRR